MKLPIRLVRVVVVLLACAAASACVVRPLGWGHRYGGEQRGERSYERHHRGP